MANVLAFATDSTGQTWVRNPLSEDWYAMKPNNIIWMDLGSSVEWNMNNEGGLNKATKEEAKILEAGLYEIRQGAKHG